MKIGLSQKLFEQLDVSTNTYIVFTLFAHVRETNIFSLLLYTCLLYYILTDWLIDVLTSSEQFFSYIQDENMLLYLYDILQSFFFFK
jgi:hypothetical protein